ncbi:hypothetical protein EV715DRAFT_215472, partial [Schizophyllum commune]
MLTRAYVPPLQRGLIDHIVRSFDLSIDQKRAVHLLGNHVLTPGAGQLLMYIGGPGGTGKSRVFEAMQSLIDLSGVDKGYLVTAPTGTASSNVHGSTYHSTFGLNPKRSGSASKKQKAATADRVRRAATCLMDEASMLAHYENYNVSKAAC